MYSVNVQMWPLLPDWTGLVICAFHTTGLIQKRSDDIDVCNKRCNRSNAVKNVHCIGTSCAAAAAATAADW